MPLEGQYEASPSTQAAKQVEGYERSGGTTHNTMRGQPVVILHTIGRRTGKLRKSPLMRVEHEGTYAVIASIGGAPQHPVWYFNLLEHPRVSLQDGAEVRDYVAREVHGDERELWWRRANAVWPDYEGYQRKTERVIPVVVLEPA